MHMLNKIWIENFRSCKQIEIEFSKYTPMVGYNNAGKSTIIQSIIWLLPPSGGLIENDFYCNDTNSPISVTGKFSGINNELLEKLGATHRTKIEPYISESGELHIKRVQSIPGNTKVNRPLFILKKDGNHNTSEDWDKNPTGIDAAISTLFPSPIHIAAMQDSAQDAAKNTSSSTLGKLLKETLGTIQEEHGQKIQTAVKELENLLSAEGDNRAPELAQIDSSTNKALKELFPGLEVRAEIPAPSIQTLFKSGTIKVKDPNRNNSWNDFESMGHGAQRTIQMALIRCLAERGQTEKNSACKLLMIDEPELYLHPQAIEQVRSALKTISDQNYQIIFSTHSPMLIEQEDVPNTLLVRNQQSGTTILPTIAEAAKRELNQNPAQREILFTLSNSNQLLFCEKALLVEGSTEARLIPFLYKQLLGRTLGVDKIALIPLGGCGGTLKAMKVLSAVGIPHKALVDIDFLFRHGKQIELLAENDPDIELCKKHFNERATNNEIEITPEGLPKNSKTKKASDAYADCYESNCKQAIENIHIRALDKSVWAWPEGDIEKIISVTGKKEPHWVRFIREAEDDGLENKILKKDTLNRFFEWMLKEI